MSSLIGVVPVTRQEQPPRPIPSAPEAILGDRRLFETRFAQCFFVKSNGDENASLSEGDPVDRDVSRPGYDPLPRPFRGQNMSCRHCHFGDDFLRFEPVAQRAYSDFTARSGIPKRNDHVTHTVRNSPGMIDLGCFPNRR